MTNHVHLLIMSGIRGLASLMQPLLTGYAVTFNLKYQRVGHLFQNRYKAILCEEDPYFLQLVRYISLQPVQAGLVRTPEALARYPWTSHRPLMGGPSEPWLETDEVLGRFGDELPTARQAYERFVVEGWNQGPRPDLEGGGLMRSLGGLDPALKLRHAREPQQADLRVLGSGDFVTQVLQQADALDQARSALAPAWSTEELINAVCGFQGVSAIALKAGAKRPAVSAARAMTIFAAKDWLGRPGTQLAEELHLSSGGLSRAYQRGKELAEKVGLLAHLKARK
jgi:hypothetical protein